MTNLSAPGFNGGALVPAGSPALPYTPVRSGLPSAMRKRPALPFPPVAAFGRATGAPATVTLTVLEGPPRMDNVYVVVAAGLTTLLPRAATEPTSGSMVMPDGFSVLHTSTVDSPGRIEAGRASK